MPITFGMVKVGENVCSQKFGQLVTENRHGILVASYIANYCSQVNSETKISFTKLSQVSGANVHLTKSWIRHSGIDQPGHHVSREVTLLGAVVP